MAGRRPRDPWGLADAITQSQVDTICDLQSLQAIQDYVTQHQDSWSDEQKRYIWMAVFFSHVKNDEQSLKKAWLDTLKINWNVDNDNPEFGALIECAISLDKIDVIKMLDNAHRFLLDFAIYNKPEMIRAFEGDVRLTNSTLPDVVCYAAMSNKLELMQAAMSVFQSHGTSFDKEISPNKIAYTIDRAIHTGHPEAAIYMVENCNQRLLLSNNYYEAIDKPELSNDTFARLFNAMPPEGKIGFMINSSNLPEFLHNGRLEINEIVSLLKSISSDRQALQICNGNPRRMRDLSLSQLLTETTLNLLGSIIPEDFSETLVNDLVQAFYPCLSSDREYYHTRLDRMYSNELASLIDQNFQRLSSASVNATQTARTMMQTLRDENNDGPKDKALQKPHV
jgi:hypothetical protein